MSNLFFVLAPWIITGVAIYGMMRAQYKINKQEFEIMRLRGEICKLYIQLSHKQNIDEELSKGEN